jgi:hypothetical protein
MVLILVRKSSLMARRPLTEIQYQESSTAQ